MTGGCLCGAVRYRADGPLDPVVVCHCSQCRRSSGHLQAFTGALREHVSVQGPVGFASTPGVTRRGFCPTCGASLFWDRLASPKLDICAGSLDAPTGLELAEHIFAADKGDYYAITDGLPQHASFGEGEA